MTYLLRKSTLGRHPVVELTGGEHQDLRTAWASMLALVQIEESWDNIIQNYLELEQGWLSAALRSSVLQTDGYHEMQDERLGFARRLSNLMTACRAYLDQTPQRLKTDLGSPESLEIFDQLRRQAHARDFGYRLIDGLRNHAQHFGLPVHGATFDSRWSQGSKDEGSRLVFSVWALINPTELARSNKLSAKLREEIQGKVNQLDAPTMVRSYLEGLSSVHAGIRQNFNESLTSWQSLVTSAIAKYAAINDGNVLALQSVELDADGSVVSAVPIFSDMPLRLQRLMQRNGSLVNLTRRVITSGPTS